MLSKQERRFIRIWEEQRKGSKAGYYALYISIWFFVTMLGLFFVFNNFTDTYRNKLSTLYQMAAAAILVAVIATHFSYRYNEQRFKKIIRREMGEGK
jgi:peptidoglycan/LPS O-acetylase OafA/YrhL